MAVLAEFLRVNRPKRNNRGQPVYDQTKRRNRKTTHTAGKKKSTAQASQVDNGSGKGRVALEQTLVVGRVYIQRMERTGMDRRREMQESRPENLGSREGTDPPRSSV